MSGATSGVGPPAGSPVCGPRLWYSDALGTELSGDPIDLAAEAIARGQIIALKGLGENNTRWREATTWN